MKTDNFERFEQLMNFVDPGDFYFVQILKRKKDNPEMNKSEKLIDSFFIYSKDEYNKLVPRMIQIAEANKARVYVRVNKRNDEKVALEVNSEVARALKSKQFASVRKAYLSACGTENSEKDRKIFIVDVDDSDPHYMIQVGNFVDQIQKQDKIKQLVHTFFKTRSGYHILTSPFNVKKFRDKYPLIQIENDASTVLYANL